MKCMLRAISGTGVEMVLHIGLRSCPHRDSTWHPYAQCRGKEEMMATTTRMRTRTKTKKTPRTRPARRKATLRTTTR